MVFQFFALLLFSSSFTIAWDYDFLSSFQSKWPEPPGQKVMQESGCTVNHLTAFEMAKGKAPMFFSTGPQDSFEEPKIQPPNGTAGEQWEFDGISEDGMLAFIFGFYRDPNYAILGTGNLRLSVEIAYANGTRFAQVDYPTDSIIESCPEGTKGIWKSKDYDYTFEITKDMGLSRITIHTPKLHGTILIKSVSPPRYADGNTWPSTSASTLTVPFFYWVEPVPVGTVEVDLVVQGEPYSFKGMGGHERLWSAFSWFTCLQGMNAVRLLLGPYALSYVSFASNIEGHKGEIYGSVVLSENGQQIFSTDRQVESDTQDYISVTKTYGGVVTGTLRDKVSGYELELVSPGTRRHWTFIVEHKNVAFEYILGGGNGGSGFSGFVTGGPIGLEQYKGMSLTEALTFPKRSPLFKSNYVA
ncbi:hypothetical protein MMC21_007987 [Puttea exsequens]|nr:hypothetical protein [Puttea exsequens]